MTASPLATAGRVLGAVPGAVLATAAAATAALRRTKPLHPVGRLGEGSLSVEPSGTSGVAVLDTPAEHAAVVRWSRAIGLDTDKPDIEGMALRLVVDGEVADLLFATTGGSRVGRHLLVPRAAGHRATFTTLLPVATRAGSLLLRLEPLDAASTDPPTAWALAWSRVGGPWHPAGSLDVAWRDGDEDVRFDPVAHQLPGTRQYAVVTALREPSYAVARLVRARPRVPGGGDD